MAWTDKGIVTVIFSALTRVLFGKLTDEQKQKMWEKVKEAESIAIESAAKGAAEGLVDKVKKQ